jgi:hypothetical protein
MMDTITLAEKLHDEGGLDERGARAIARGIHESIQGTASTKADLLQLELKLESRFSKVDARFERLEAKFDKCLWLGGSVFALVGFALLKYIFFGSFKIG